MRDKGTSSRYVRSARHSGTPVRAAGCACGATSAMLIARGSSKRSWYGLPCLHVVVTFLDSQVCVKNTEKCLVLTYKTKWASGLGDRERPSPPSQSFSAGRFFVSGAALHVPAVPCARRMPEAPSTDEEPHRDAVPWEPWLSRGSGSGRGHSVVSCWHRGGLSSRAVLCRVSSSRQKQQWAPGE